MSFLQVSVFSGHQLGDYFLNQVTRTKIIVVMAPKVVTAWRVAVISQSVFTRWDHILAQIMSLLKLILGKRIFLRMSIFRWHFLKKNIFKVFFVCDEILLAGAAIPLFNSYK